MSVFTLKDRIEAYPYRFAGEITVATICGGTPMNEKVAEGWIKTKMGMDAGDQLREKVAETMAQIGKTADEAVGIVNDLAHKNTFKHDEKGLYIEGRQLKAAIKEAASVALAADQLAARGWGKTNKGVLGFVAEHIFVAEDRLYLGVEEPTGTMQRFVHTFRGDAIQYEDYVDNAVIEFTIVSDYNFLARDWKAIWLKGEMQGIGSSRSQGYGRYEVTRWESINA